MDIARLRRETEQDHTDVEGSLPLMSSDLTVPVYISVLQRLHGFVVGWERWADQVAPPHVRAMLHVRRRSQLLQADLAYFRAAASQETYSGLTVRMVRPAHVLGALYVMEGSTLGGQLIARHVQVVLHLDQGYGDAFFRGYGEHTGRMWREVKDALTAWPESDADDVIVGAKAMFGDFAGWFKNKVQEQAPETILA